MKQGKSIVEMAEELQRQATDKRDFIADTRVVNFNNDNKLEIIGQGEFNITDHTHRQIAQRVGIPQKYYDRMRDESPLLLANNVEHWFRKQPEQRMIRTLDGNARAFLSNRYRTLDNTDLAEAVLPILLESDSIQIISSEITPSKLYIKALFPKLENEIAKGDVVQSGVVISNSEIGLGALKIEPLVYRLVCLNGMISKDHGTRKYHVGRVTDMGDGAHEFFRDETLMQDDKAYWLKVQDIVRASMDQAKFEVIVNKMRATKDIIIDHPIEAIEVVANKFTFNDQEKTGVLNQLIQGGDLSGYGVLNAITRHSQDIDDYDRATEFERVGGNIIELPKHDWAEILQAA